MGGLDYAAKTHFNQDGTPLDEGDNYKRLKKELTRQATAKLMLAKFTRLAGKSGNVVPIAGASRFSEKMTYFVVLRKPNIADIEVADQFLLTVENGSEVERSWIADMYRPNGKFMKYSGTKGAGRNWDTFGTTCDAFAHFALWKSDYGFVLTDIQGMCFRFCTLR